jgi:hypothetical protein
MPESSLSDRIKVLIEKSRQIPKDDVLAWGNELLQGTLTTLVQLYGVDSPQLLNLQDAHKRALQDGTSGDIDWRTRRAVPVVRGALENALAELNAGLVGNLRKEITGDVLTDFVQLARVTLESKGEGTKNVAAVLAAAAYEDTIRRMGRDFAGVVGRDDLSDVIAALKKEGVLKAPQLGIAISYLNFRNHALHANWDQIDRSSVTSVLGFVEELLLKHFA